MSCLVCLQGLPASGKSTKAAELVKEYGNAVRINRDSLRAMLHCDLPWSGQKERITKNMARAMTRHLLCDGKTGTVLIDDCNLHPSVVESWRSLAQECGAKFETLRLDTSLEECLRRDALREKRVGRSVIVGMAMQFGLYPRPAKGVVLVDLDGTMADIGHRLHHVKQEPKDWQGFFRAIPDDTPREEVVNIVRGYWKRGYQIMFVSGRPETYRGHTELWLSPVFPHYMALFMRRWGDHRPDTTVKEEMLTTYFQDRSWVYRVIDDRKSVIEMWRSYGLNVVDVGDGTDF